VSVRASGDSLWDRLGWRQLLNDRALVYSLAAVLVLAGLIAGLWVHLAVGENAFAKVPRSATERDVVLYGDLVARQPKTPENWRNYVHALIVARRLDDAKTAIARGLKATKQNPAVELEQAYLLAAEGDTEQAIQTAQDAGKREDARLLAESKKLAAQGIEVSVQQLDTTTRTEAWTLAGQLQSRLGQWEAAIKSFDRALQSDPNLVDVLLARGTAHLEAHHPKRARKDLERVLVLDPSNAAATSQLDRLADQ
jgi:tetratricopeptide (TPR) repeat protein